MNLPLATGPPEASFFSDAPEENYAAETAASARKPLGQFFTPYVVARFMASWIRGAKPLKTVLDPAVGAGVFARALIEGEDSAAFDLVGCDVDPAVLAVADRTFAQHGRSDRIRLENRDYLTTAWSDRFDGIICNPPYLRFQDYPDREKLLRLFADRLGVALSGYTNIYTLFILKALSQLSDRGRAAFIVPSEFMGTGYGEVIKAHIIRSEALRCLIVFDSALRVFPSVATTTAILLFEAGGGQDNVVQLVECGSLVDLAGLSIAPSGSEETQARYVEGAASGATACMRADALLPQRKWRTYFPSNRRTTYRNVAPLSTFGRVSRGIATGSNAFFTMSKQKADALSLPSGVLIRCVTRSAQAPRTAFSRGDFDALEENGASVFVFDAQADPEDQHVREYVRSGEEAGVSDRYLTRSRSPWYAIEDRAPAPIWATVFSRGGVRVVRNFAMVRNLTCFHGLYVDPMFEDKTDLLFAYLLTDVARELLDDQKRQYGDGLDKFEPNDLNRANVIDVSTVSAADQAELLGFYARYATCEANGDDCSRELAALDDAFRSALAP